MSAANELLLVVLLLASVAVGCGGQEVPKPPADAVGRDADLPAVLATINGSPITLADLGPALGDALARLELSYRRERSALVRAALDSVLRQRVLVTEAQRQGKSLEDLVRAQAGGSLEPSEADLAAWYAANQARVAGRPLEQLRVPIAALLRQQRHAAALEQLRQRLYRQQGVVVALPQFRVTIDNRDAPSLGPADAPVALVVFSDFQCPYCGAFYGTLKRVEQTFGDSLKVVFRQFPLESIHPNALKAAEASLCANEQEKFWAMHDAMFQNQARLGVDSLKATAGRLGLDRRRFDACLDSGRTVERIRQDQKEGFRLAVDGTPALFLNGIPVNGGAVPYEVLAQAIREELARQSKR